jgi:hypothetical protein
MQIRCECGTFRAALTGFPTNTPGRLVCYCDDCQTYLHWLGRPDLLDSAGGTEVIPVYPSEVSFVAGREALVSMRLSPDGLLRWYSSCCKTPIANTRPKFPWVGVIHRAYSVDDPGLLERVLGPVRSRINGQFARGAPPSRTSSKMGLKDVAVVLPFLLKGAVLGRAKHSPFFEEDGVTPAVAPIVLPPEERTAIRRRLGFEGRSS